MIAVQVNSFEIEPGRNNVSCGDTGFLLCTSAKPSPLAKSSFPSFTTEIVAPAMSLRPSCKGTMPSRNASTSAAVISCVPFATDVGAACSTLSAWIGAGPVGAWPITHNAKTKAIVSNAIVVLTTRLLFVWLHYPDLPEHSFKVATQNSFNL